MTVQKHSPAKHTSTKKTRDKNPQEEDVDDIKEEDDEQEELPADAAKPSKTKKTTPKAKGKVAAAKQRAERLCEGTTPAWVEFEKSFFGKVAGEQILSAFNKRFPRLNYDELDVILPKPIPEAAYDEDWTVSNEAKLDKRWMANPLRKDLIDYKDSALPKLFRVMIRIFRITPFDFLSPKFLLQYAGSPGNKSQRWTTTFSQHIYRLIVHPLWDFDINLLKIAIQYAVILRTRDARTWKFIAPNNEHFFQTFKKVIQEFKGQHRPLAELHGLVRKRLRERSIPTPPYSQFMRRLEKTVQVDNDIEEDVTDEDGPLETYPVGNADLKNITDALDSMTHVGLPYFPSADVFCRYILAIRQGGSKETGKGSSKAETKDDPPFGQQKTKEYIERALVAVRRFEAKEKNRKKRLRHIGEIEGEDSIVQAPDDLEMSVEAGLRAQQAADRDTIARLQRMNNKLRVENDRLKRRVSQGDGPIEPSSDSSSESISDSEKDSED
ncbi:hypothetical protein CGCSCA4_v003409 [Colletotrichum siamense]|uniref:Uncharacterized protein n=1 Tax=Colletotrichum siamense TaxID=690259 RepID=A0A9P5K839_COLSI|nr:hypothetical protein CGCSCA4_v003409 [Colletotrichum siamense]KAF4862843.1 hypothetical protein CGCSCA2_v003373 [Colletotrichum siamense]